MAASYVPPGLLRGRRARLRGRKSGSGDSIALSPVWCASSPLDWLAARSRSRLEMVDDRSDRPVAKGARVRAALREKRKRAEPPVERPSRCRLFARPARTDSISRVSTRGCVPYASYFVKNPSNFPRSQRRELHASDAAPISSISRSNSPSISSPRPPRASIGPAKDLQGVIDSVGLDRSHASG